MFGLVFLPENLLVHVTWTRTLCPKNLESNRDKMMQWDIWLSSILALMNPPRIRGVAFLGDPSPQVVGHKAITGLGSWKPLPPYWDIEVVLKLRPMRSHLQHYGRSYWNSPISEALPSFKILQSQAYLIKNSSPTLLFWVNMIWSYWNFLFLVITIN